MFTLENQGLRKHVQAPLMGNPMDGLDAARDMYEKYRAGATEEVRTNLAKEWLSAIVGYPLPGSRIAISSKLEKEATTAYKEGRYEEALDRFCHWLAIVDADPSTGISSELRATLTANVAACLAALGMLQPAIEFYERAVMEFKTLPFSVIRDITLGRLVYGKLTDRRVDYIEGKLGLLRAGKPPELDTYQDAFGVTRKWSQEEMEGKRHFNLYNPLTWLDYGRQKVYTQVGDQRTAAAEGEGQSQPPKAPINPYNPESAEMI